MNGATPEGWNWLNSAVTPVVSGLCALIAAWVGTKLGLRKFRQERAFDARLEWHRNLAETAKTLRNRTRSFVAFQRMDTPAEVALPLVSELGELSFKFQEQAELSALYATKRTHAAIQDVLAKMTAVAQPAADNPTAMTPQKAQEIYRSSISGQEQVYDLLAQDLREMLGLAHLDERGSP